MFRQHLPVMLGGGGLCLRKNSNISLSIFFEEGPRPCPKAELLSLGGSFLVSASPPFPDSKLFEPVLQNSGKVMEAEVYALKTRNGDAERFVPGSPQGPARFQLQLGMVIAK